MTRACCALVVDLALVAPSAAADGPNVADFVEAFCVGCHDSATKKGNLDLSALKFGPDDPDNLRVWVKAHDRVRAGEMPPKGRSQPTAAERVAFAASVGSAITTHERSVTLADGRAARRRLNTHEYEAVLRDLFGAPWLDLKSRLPEDGEAWHFNKSAEALDASHVLLARYLKAADYAMRQVISTQLTRVPTTKVRHYARAQGSMTAFTASLTSSVIDKKRFPVLDAKAQPDVRTGKAPMSSEATHDREAVGAVMSAFAPGTNYGWDTFKAPVAGRYRIRIAGYTVWVGPSPDGKGRDGRPVSRKHLPNYDDVSTGRRGEPMTVFTTNGPNNRTLTTFDFTPEPQTHDLGDLWLVAGEQFATDPSRFYRRRGGEAMNSLADGDGMPGVAFQWLEVEGPLYNDPVVSPGYRLLFGELPIRTVKTSDTAPKAKKPELSGRLARGSTPKDALDGVALEVVTADPQADAARLMTAFVRRAYRQPVAAEDVKPFLDLVAGRMKAGLNFCDAMLAGYSAVLTSPGFLFTGGDPGRLDDHALAERLALFLWNTEPDAALRVKADRGELRKPEVLRAETDRLLDDSRSQRFVDAFLDYWVEARKVEATAPSATLYGDYDMDYGLRDAALAETRAFFADLVTSNRPARNLIDCDYAFVNGRLAAHYGMPGVDGVATRKVTLPTDSPRGGLMTQALILKVTANGTTTSPVVRGKWITERLLGYEIPPPPPVPAIEPDIRGAVTIREQLDKHRADPGCAACHSRIDPLGFALESFDVFGGWRDRYRAVAENAPPSPGRTKEGYPFAFRDGPPVDPAGEFRAAKFADVREFKRLLRAEETQVARNLLHQLVVYATGTPVRFSDRDAGERILDQAKANEYGVRSLIHGLIQSELFINK